MTKFHGFLVLAAVLFSQTVCGQVRKSEGAAVRKPNVLFIVADDMNRYSVLKNYPVLQTPAIDKLVSQSYLFTNASCAAPVCIPSRTSFFSGRYPHNTGAYFNGVNPWENPLLAATEVIPETFKKNGYETWGRGKSFHVELPDGREQAMFDNKIFKGGYGPFGLKKDWYGRNRWSVIKPWEGPDTDFPDVKNADAAIAFLSQAHDRPFFMYLGLFRPHTPYTAPKRFWDLYKDVQFTLPPGYLESDLDDVPGLGRELVDSMKNYSREGMTREEVLLTMLRAYCANTSFADWNLGRVLEALNKSPFAQNTIVIFCSDNGFHTGAKNHWVKSTLWDQADMVPMLIRLPDGKAYRCPQTVSLIDIYPTLVDYCGLKGPGHPLDGRSMVPILKNPAAKWERNGYTVYGAGYSGVCDERYRYIRYPDGSEELYDHKSDPYEHKNIASQKGMETVKKRLAATIPAKFAKSMGGRGEIRSEE
ncbi:sulfatase [Chitinophaga sp.]|uniref:sulfatase n=1 Tax=Chitinophaga sp. TaxID=1869181 RepID=UPI0031DCD2E1